MQRMTMIVLVATLFFAHCRTTTTRPSELQTDETRNVLHGVCNRNELDGTGDSDRLRLCDFLHRPKRAEVLSKPPRAKICASAETLGSWEKGIKRVLRADGRVVFRGTDGEAPTAGDLKCLNVLGDLYIENVISLFLSPKDVYPLLGSAIATRRT